MTSSAWLDSHQLGSGFAAELSSPRGREPDFDFFVRQLKDDVITGLSGLQDTAPGADWQAIVATELFMHHGLWIVRLVGTADDAVAADVTAGRTAVAYICGLIRDAPTPVGIIKEVDGHVGIIGLAGLGSGQLQIHQQSLADAGYLLILAELGRFGRIG